jgi:tol-pal system protein YbgF
MAGVHQKLAGGRNTPGIRHSKGMNMKTRITVATMAVITALILTVGPSQGANKDIIQLQVQVQALQDQMSRMQQTFDERMGVMRNLVEHNSDSVNKAVAAINELNANMQRQQGDSSGKVDQVSGQIQALNDTMDEVKARLAKVSKQLEDMQASQQNLNSQNQAQQKAAQQQAQAPPPDVLYNNALRDYNAGKNDIASQEFNDYVKFYPNTDLAGNAFFYIAEIEFKQGNFQQAAKDYDQVIQNFPGGNKAAAAELKKGMAQVQLGQKDEGVRSFRHVVQRFPRSNEAAQAREQLRKLGVALTASKPSAGREQ